MTPNSNANPETTTTTTKTTSVVATITAKSILSSIFYLPFYAMGSFRSWVYDVLILKMTTKWYQVVLQQIPENSIVLDVGIGTAGALLNCASLLKSRNIKVLGLDYDADYILQAQTAISNANLQDHVSVICMSVYDAASTPHHEQLWKTVPPTWRYPPNDDIHDTQRQQQYFDAIYFSGSFSLLPDMVGALNVVKQLLSPTGSSKIYITQTYQRKSPPLFSIIKPMLRYMITIDFGQLVTEKKAFHMFHEEFTSKCNLTVQEHSVIPESIDTMLQAAYLTILVPNSNKENNATK